MINFLRKYKHGLIILIYSIVYTLMFAALEQRTVYGCHIVHTIFDDAIPFCEYFVVPYLLWFPYMILAVVYFIFFNKNKREYFQLIFNLMMGMTIFLIVSYVFPNAQHLRPAEFPRDNVFASVVGWLYQHDTPTNVLPSIHVFNSLAIHMALSNCEAFKKHKAIPHASLVLTILIILSTMFLKQHSVIDVCLGSTLALFGYLVFYPQRAAQEHSRNTSFSHSSGKRRRDY